MEREATPNRHPSPTKQSSQALPDPSPSPRPPPFNSQEHVEMYPSQLDEDEDNQMHDDEDQTVRAPVNPPKIEPKEAPRQEPPRRAATRTPEQQQPQPQTPKRNGHVERQNGGQGMDMQSPGHIPPFDWEEFEARYEQALTQSNKEQEQLLKEFDQLVKYFNVWASAASAHDNERAVKRLQTRERFVRISEQSLDQKKQHLKEVVQAFKSALALLNRPA